MTDKETSLEFVERIVASQPRIHTGYITISTSDMERLLQGFETAALIEEHGLGVTPPDERDFPQWTVTLYNGDNPDRIIDNADLATAVLAVADKVKEGK